MESLPWDMIGAIFGALSFLLALILDWHRLEGIWRRVIIALIIGCAVFLVIYLVPTLLFPSPENTLTETLPIETPSETTQSQTTEEVQPSDSNSTVYDNFNNSVFDEKWNNGLWLPYGNLNTVIEQNNGVMQFSRNNPDEGGLTATQTWTIDEISFIEAKVNLDSKTEASIGSVGIQITTNISGMTWWLTCSIYNNKNTDIAEAHCGAADNYNSQSIALSLNSWHTIRIETNPDTAKITFFIDNSRIDTYVHKNPDEFKKSFFHLYIGVWSQDGGLVTGSVDDVQVGSQ